ncbi:hypothetical protein ADIMK_1860 [Marinobacterium lacunae]|uniref:PA2779 family protein n=1 Tax=Marinobacterium lacunae TaxID=1232683 RepID=A0A081G020_9GAMM|nr:PA2779 family protein [Marinobacterium lacunae]KEA64125.1 hypothetical protein ADIMK_1860 [Marinobacterium lacunae]MBR9885826.1 PA2779 family protein [Oceanospirillales bacterium]
MNLHKVTRSRFIAAMVAALFTFTGIQAPAYAAIVSTDQIANQTELDAKRAQLSEMLMRDDVKQQMIALGVDTNTVQDRINSLTPAELAQLEGRMDQLPAGSGALGTIALVLLILILLDIAGVTDIFPRI